MKTLIKKFEDLEVGDFFIGFPSDGDNKGHGGYLVTHYLYKKVGNYNAKRYDLEDKKYKQETTLPNQFEVIKIK